LRRTAQLPPKAKEPDHFDLMVQYADVQHERGEQEKLEKQRARLADFRAGLDVQLQERQRRKEEEQQERRHWHQVVQKKAEDFAQQQAADAKAKELLKDEQRRSAAADAERLRQKKEVEEQARKKEQEDLLKTLEVEKAHKERVELTKKQGAEKRAQEARANFETVAREREARRAADAEETRLAVAEAAKRSIAREAAANAEYRKRQAIVDARMATLGVACAELEAKKAAALEQRIDRDHEEWKQKSLSEFWKRVEREQGHVRELAATNRTMGSTWRATQGAPEREMAAEQSRIWRQQDAEFQEASRKKGELARKRRDEIDDELLKTMHRNAERHNSEFGVTEESRAKEMAYHKGILDRMAADGFRSDLTATLSLQAHQATMTMRSVGRAR